MKTIKLSILLLALLTLGQATWAQNLIINSVDDWNTFAQSVTNGTTYSGQTVQLTADIAVSTIAGTDDKCFAGTFDGQGHTITLNMTANRQFTALFSYADGATFQNLKVDGTINTAVHKFCAGIVGAIVYHGCTFTNCVSDVTINSSISGDGTHGGLVAYVGKGDNTFEGCAFTGKLLGANTSYVGGLVGFTDSRNYATVSFTNCVFHPQQVTMSGTGSQTFARWYGNNSGSVTIGDNCYYSQTLGAAQGKQMRSITGGDYVTVAFSGNATTYERSGISAYSVGIVYGSTLYAGNGDTVSLNLSCTQPSGYVCSGYTTNNGTLTGTANPYTLTMPNEAVTIQAVLEQPPVAYVDENGVQQQCTSYTVVTSNLNFGNLPAGWYVVNSNITLNNRQVHFSGDAHLILCDGKTMNINCVSGMIALQPDGSLTLYGQSGGRGSLTVTSGYNHGIDISQNLTINGCTVTATGGSNGINTANLTINGGTVNATSTDNSGTYSGINAGNLTINGSNVTATGGNNGITATDLTINGSIVTATGNNTSGISATYLTINGGTVTATGSNSCGIFALWLTINSGTINATGNDSGIYIGNDYGYVTINGGTVTANKIFSPTVTLGWSNTTDRITVGNFAYSSTPTVSVKSGQALCYEEDEDNSGQVIISGTLDEDQIEVIGGKTLVPYSLEPVVYIDENGVQQHCTFYTVVTNNLNFENLPSGWYVVNDSITRNNRVYFTGDAHLILCDSTTMNISVSTDEALKTDGSLTLYGQIGGMGSLTATSDDGHGINAPNLTINGCTVNATSTANYSSSRFGISATNLTINGGTVTATSIYKGISADDLTINGSSVTVSGNDYGISVSNLTINGSTVTASGSYAGITTNNLIINGSTVTATGSSYGISAVRVTINSGTVNATGNNSLGISIGNASGYVTINGGTVNTNRIYSPTVTLGWSSTTDSITVGSFTYWSTFTVSVKSGQAFYYQNGNETVVVSDTLNSGQISAIGGKTLRPYLGPCASPLNLEVTDIETTTATLHWMGFQESYNVRYRMVVRAYDWIETTANTTTLDIANLEPGTTYEWQVQGVDCDGNGTSTDWSEWSTFTTLISCYPVNSLSYDNLTSFSVNLNWILLDEAQTDWQICVNGNENNLIAANTNEGFLLDGLMPDVEYTVKVRAYCDENDYSSWSDTVTFTTPEVCFTPRNLAANNITAVSTDLSWTGREDVESYTVRYRTMAERIGEWITETTSETEAQLTDLDGGTTYEAQVRSDCNPDGWCNMITFTTLDENTKVFVFEGEWSDGDNWVPVGVPTIDNDVILRANATVFDVAEANVITIDDAGALMIEDGGQLKTNADVEATMKKFVIGYGSDYVETDKGYYLMTLPTVAPISAADAHLLTEESDYDLYSWDRTATDEEWQNNHSGIDLQNGVGFLYANRDDREMLFTATLRNSSEPVVVTLSYDEAEYGGWNLCGNPFPCEAYITTEAEGMTFYRLVDNQLELFEGAISPMEGFFVKATAANQTFTISREAPAKHVQP